MAHAALGLGYNYKSYYSIRERSRIRTQRAHGEMNRDAKANKHDGIALHPKLIAAEAQQGE